MKRFLSVKGVLLVTLLLVGALGAGTAVGSPQAAVAPQESLERLDGATIVTSNLCAANDHEFKIYVSGFGAGEIVIVSVVKDSDNSLIWYSGDVNPAGALELEVNIVTKPPNATSDNVRYPGAGLFTLEAFGVSGRLATTPIMAVDESCDADSMMMDDMDKPSDT